MLPDRSVLIGQKLVENAKIQKFKCDILDDFQTMCEGKMNHKWIKNGKIKIREKNSRILFTVNSVRFLSIQQAFG